MDRLSPVIVATLALALAGCHSGDSGKSGKAGAGAKRSRVEAVEAKPDPRFEPGQFCEQWQPEGGPAFEFPPLAAGDPPKPGAKRWVNVWATWCAPCVEEFPRIVEWKAKLAEAGHATEVVFVSVDDAEADLAGFTEAHPEVEGSLQIADPEQLGPWLTRIGLSEGSVLPIHLFVDAAGKLRCVRMGGVGPEDFPGVAAVMQAI